jgi:hypothetical protein
VRCSPIRPKEKSCNAKGIREGTRIGMIRQANAVFAAAVSHKIKLRRTGEEYTDAKYDARYQRKG